MGPSVLSQDAKPRWGAAAASQTPTSITEPTLAKPRDQTAGCQTPRSEPRKGCMTAVHIPRSGLISGFSFRGLGFETVGGPLMEKAGSQTWGATPAFTGRLGGGDPVV